MLVMKKKGCSKVNDKAEAIIDLYASKAFNDAAMRKYLPGDTYKQQIGRAHV